jgi:hypothetical protein
VKHNIVPGMKFCTVYIAYFRVLVWDQDKFWAPHVCCGSCQSILEWWLRGIRKCGLFAIPWIWRDFTNHHNDCYFCVIDISTNTSRIEEPVYRIKEWYKSVHSVGYLC